MATIKDVARLAGVSLGTVSNYLNGRAPVAKPTAGRIQKAIDELGYRIDWGARALRVRRTKSVGLIVPDISNPFYSEIARVVAHELWDHGFQTLLCDSASNEEREFMHLHNLASRRVDGVLMIYSSERADFKHIGDDLDVPISFIDRDMPGFPSVTSDNYLGGKLAAQHLVTLGHRCVAVLEGAGGVPNIQRRMAGFRDGLASYGVSLPAANVATGPQSFELGLLAESLMTLEPQPTALFVTNDIVAIGAWRTLLGLGYRIPEDVSLLGFDNIEMSRLLIPPLSTVAQDKVAMGREATLLLLGLIAGEQTPSSVVIAPHLVFRGSTAAPRKEVAAMSR